MACAVARAGHVFRRIHGTWSEQQVLPGADVRQSAASGGCLFNFGLRVVLSGRWLVATAPIFEPFQSSSPVIYRREAGQFMPMAGATGSMVSTPVLHLSGRTLFVGVPFEQGCNFEFCLGMATVHRLDEIPAQQ